MAFILVMTLVFKWFSCELNSLNSFCVSDCFLLTLVQAIHCRRAVDSIKHFEFFDEEKILFFVMIQSSIRVFLLFTPLMCFDSIFNLLEKVTDNSFLFLCRALVFLFLHFLNSGNKIKCPKIGISTSDQF